MSVSAGQSERDNSKNRKTMSHRQHGGSKLGQGNKGATYTLGPDSAGDRETAIEFMCDLVRSGRATSAVGYHFDDEYRTKRVRLDAADLKLLTASLARMRSSGHYIGKRFVSNAPGDRRETFGQERRVVAQLAAAGVFGKNMGARSTLSPPRVRGMLLYAVELHPCDEYLIFSMRCGPTLDGYAFDGESIVRFVSDMLRSFAMIHGSGYVHGDVKLDNMIHCSADDRFKLIDWGLAEGVARLRARYLRGVGRPKNYGSPLSWHLYLGALGPAKYLGSLDGGLLGALGSAQHFGSLEPAKGWVTYMGYYTLKMFRDLRLRPGFRRFILQAGSSFNAWLVRHSAASKSKSKDDQRTFDKYKWSFDLFNLGMTIARLATDPRVARRVPNDTRANLLTLARRLTHYGDDDFVGDDANRALRAWRRMIAL